MYLPLILKHVTLSGNKDFIIPKDSGDKDLINSLINTVNKQKSLQTNLITGQPSLQIDYSDYGRIQKMKEDPDFKNKLSDKFELLSRYGLLHYYPQIYTERIVEPPNKIKK